MDTGDTSANFFTLGTTSATFGYLLMVCHRSPSCPLCDSVQPGLNSQRLPLSLASLDARRSTPLELEQ
jgi:hypothetical protein